MKRTLAKEALYSSQSHSTLMGQPEPHDIPAMQSVTREHLEKIDPGGKKALALLKEFEKPETRTQ